MRNLPPINKVESRAVLDSVIELLKLRANKDFDNIESWESHEAADFITITVKFYHPL